MIFKGLSIKQITPSESPTLKILAKHDDSCRREVILFFLSFLKLLKHTNISSFHLPLHIIHNNLDPEAATGGVL